MEILDIDKKNLRSVSGECKTFFSKSIEITGLLDGMEMLLNNPEYRLVREKKLRLLFLNALAIRRLAYAIAKDMYALTKATRDHHKTTCFIIVENVASKDGDVEKDKKRFEPVIEEIRLLIKQEDAIRQWCRIFGIKFGARGPELSLKELYYG